jgi:hypothetical protein
MAGAAGGFVTRAFEAMLKECAANRGKFAALQQSIQSYLGACVRPPFLPLLPRIGISWWLMMELWLSLRGSCRCR